MKTQEYDLEYFIAKFEAIPEDQWTDKGVYVDENGCKCAYGHCGAVNEFGDTSEAESLFFLDMESEESITRINDNKTGKFDYLGSTPKQRVVNYLKSLR